MRSICKRFRYAVTHAAPRRVANDKLRKSLEINQAFDFGMNLPLSEEIASEVHQTMICLCILEDFYCKSNFVRFEK